MTKFIFLVLLSCTVLNAWKIDRSTQFIVDDNNLNRVYHGVNVVYKIHPFYPPITDRFHPEDSLADIDLENLRDWGFNMIRLYVAWEAVEPTRKNYNLNYLAELKKIVQRCEKYGIVVLLDAHQDVLSRFFCGNGLPDWAVTRSPYRFPAPLKISMNYDKEGVPLMSDCLKNKFLQYYLTQDVGATFESLFRNTNGVADDFANFWGVVAKYFANEPNVIGYEIINEPLPASPFKSMYDLLFPNSGNNKNLLPLYQRVSKQIRLHDKEKLLFFEPGTTDVFGSGFQDSPGGLKWRSKEVYSYHIYCPLVDNNSVPTDENACKMIDNMFFAKKEQAAQKLGIGKFLTEFGAIIDSPAGNRELDRVLSLAESKFTSWAYWEFKYYGDITTQAMPGTIEAFYDSKGNLYTNKVKTLSRPYATAVCGTPVTTQFNSGSSSHQFTLTWKHSTSCNGKRTILFLSQKFYYRNFNSNFKNCSGCSLNKIMNSYYEVVVPSNVSQNTEITVTIVEA